MCINNGEHDIITCPKCGICFECLEGFDDNCTNCGAYYSWTSEYINEECNDIQFFIDWS